ncbi:MAG TPA: glycosyltransferase family 4 protein [Tepidisphaeraceae bacterium]|nr:glycosyltransferase family 4 protein [Tepidisphaeraceae bacterium]
MANRLREQELKRFKVRTVRNGIDATLFSPCESDRRKFGLPLDVPVILHSAWRAGDWEINHRKGLMHLSEAFVKHVLPRFPHAVLAVAGESIAPNHPNVKPLGIINQEQLPSLLGSVDVFVTSTLADNLPYTILEAMGCAKAVIASRVGGIPEQVVDGETGLLVEAGNIFELGHAIIQQFSDPERTRLYGLAGRERVKKLFGIKQFVGGYEDIFIQLATSRSRPVSDFRPH